MDSCPPRRLCLDHDSLTFGMGASHSRAPRVAHAGPAGVKNCFAACPSLGILVTAVAAHGIKPMLSLPAHLRPQVGSEAVLVIEVPQRMRPRRREGWRPPSSSPVRLKIFASSRGQRRDRFEVDAVGNKSPREGRFRVASVALALVIRHQRAWLVESTMHCKMNNFLVIKPPDDGVRPSTPSSSTLSSHTIS